MTQPTSIQLERAAKLAKAFHHLWSEHYTEEMTTIEEIRAASEPFDDEYCPILAPTMNQFGDIVHETNNKRVSWTIHPNGAVEISISRPQGIVLYSHLKAEDIHDSSELKWNVDIPLHLRHIEAMRQALSAFYDEAEIDESIGHLIPHVTYEEGNDVFYCRPAVSRTWFVLPEGEITHGTLVTATCEHGASENARSIFEVANKLPGKVILLHHHNL